MASSSHSTNPSPYSKYDVFISFRGKDSRNRFVSDLSRACCRKGINAFIDDRLDKGEEISETLSNNISESLASVVVLTPNYAESRWCMNELVKIMECKEKGRQTVLPVFLGVEPTHVRKQTGAFGDGFRRLIMDRKFKSNEQTWRRALGEIANLSGWDSNVKSEANIIDGVVQRVEEIVYLMHSKEFFDFCLGIGRVEELKSMLRGPAGLGKEVLSIGIWGMAGIGKTTLARKVYHEISHLYDATCFLSNVGRRLRRDGVDAFSKDMHWQLLNSEILPNPLHFSSPIVRRILERKKLLIVLDDVDDCPQLQTLVEKHKFYGPGSSIILISRNKQILRNGCDAVYEVEELNFADDSLQLFEGLNIVDCPQQFRRLNFPPLQDFKDMVFKMSASVVIAKLINSVFE